MYEVDERDTVVELSDVPRSSPGAPWPVVVADEHHVQLAYLADACGQDWDGIDVRVVDLRSDEPVVLVTFERARAWFHGPPSDEAFAGHPLAARGLHPYAVFRIDGRWRGCSAYVAGYELGTRWCLERSAGPGAESSIT